MRVCKQKSTGKFIEAQSNDDASFDAMRENAIAAGYDAKDLEFSILPDAEVTRLINAENQKDAPPPPLSTERLFAALEKKGVLTKGDL